MSHLHTKMWKQAPDEWELSYKMHLLAQSHKTISEVKLAVKFYSF